MLHETEVLRLLDPNQPHARRREALQSLITQLETKNMLSDRCIESLCTSPLDALLMSCTDRELQLGTIRVFLLAGIDPCFKQPEFGASFRCITMTNFTLTSKALLREIDRACTSQHIMDFDVPAITISHESKAQTIHDAWVNISESGIGVYGCVTNGDLFVDISYSSIADWLIKENKCLELILNGEGGQEARVLMNSLTVPPATLSQIISRLSCIKKRKLSQPEHLIQLPAVSSARRCATPLQSGDVLCGVIDRIMRSKSRSIERKLKKTQHSIVERIKTLGCARIRRHCAAMGTTICTVLDRAADSSKYSTLSSKEIFQ